MKRYTRTHARRLVSNENGSPLSVANELKRLKNCAKESEKKKDERERALEREREKEIWGGIWCSFAPLGVQPGLVRWQV